jgi:4-hydroxythreonine-4-phosphate dehydrogenase
VSPRIAVTLGDPRGIGPEIVSRVLADPPAGAEYVVAGPAALIDDLPAATRIAVEDPGGGPALTKESRLTLAPERAGRLAGRAVEQAAALALGGEVSAIVTGPVEKRALHLAGYPYPGHTEWLAALAGGVDVAMMLASDRLRVVLVTTHIPLKDVPRALSSERVIATGRITQRALQSWWGIPAPRLAVCAVNPHAGEGGLFGDEDRTVLGPAVEVLGAAGPFPADTVFVRAMRGEFDAVLAPYHDVGMTAIKVASFGRGVNITLGLPFVRTAPDHGTAFDIAGKGIADPGSMREAVRIAIQLANRRIGG